MDQDNFTVKITKKIVLDKIRGSVVNQDWYLVHGRIYNKANTRYRRFKFVLCIDLCDDLWDSELDMEIPYNTALEDAIFSFTDCIRSYDDVDGFYSVCNDSIHHWNDLHTAK